MLPQSLAEQTGYSAHFQDVAGVLGYWLEQRFLTPESIVGADILDFGGGSGPLAILLMERGAKSVTVLDPDLDEPFYQRHFRQINGLDYYKGTVQSFASEHAGQTFDLVVSCSVTEHVMNLADALKVIHVILRPGGAFFTAHDNYYHPSGAHDNFMLRAEPEGYAFAGPECWNSAERCEASREFRAAMSASAPWSWNAAADSALTPSDCGRCAFFKRARPWAHLLNADAFSSVFPQPFFTSGLNKITPFMLRQFILEAGFTLDVWHRHLVQNTPPHELLGDPYWHNETDLKTLNIIARASRP